MLSLLTIYSLTRIKAMGLSLETSIKLFCSPRCHFKFFTRMFLPLNKYIIVFFFFFLLFFIASVELLNSFIIILIDKFIQTKQKRILKFVDIMH